MKEIKFAKAVVFINSLVPLALLAWDAYHHRLGANPLEFVTHTTGTLALVFLLISLAVTPLRRLLGLGWLVKLRRMLGLYAFFYASLHLITYFWFDKFFNLRAAAADIAKRPFIAVGMLAFFLLVPLAVTSTNTMVKRLGGKRWRRLHKIVYIAAALGILHYYLLVKADTRTPLWFAAALGVLLAYRLFYAYLPVSLKMSRKPTADNTSSDL
ncbi:MAG TPA: protein-methionine-sulfoxide reductase heme-binding subunit MsrQ [Blastocatellia bacterium]|nr:protein-methionine-sulfoxide reductase heme-binding subunit MsrQ [Blastocatellia bacterium]